MSEELQNWLGSGPGPQRCLARISRHGHPLLYFPVRRALALQSLELYPAQRPAARAARAALQVLCSLGMARALPSSCFTFPFESPTTTFLAGVCQGGASPQELAIIAGNPATPGRRYILLLYDGQSRPAAVIKVGVNSCAAALVVQEAEALQAINTRTSVAPRVLATHECGLTRALALEYVPGHTPHRATAHDLARVLTPWVDARRNVTAQDVPAWRRLCEAVPPQPALAGVRSRVESATFHPSLYHGDFAPWNVKVQADGSWRVLDWERGELLGMPCWDWFHYHVQLGLLVQRLDTATHAQSVCRLLADQRLLRYADAAGVRAILRELLLAYLLHSMHILGPKESLPAKQALLDTLAAQWKSG